MALATKFILWPLVVWFAATRRGLTAALSIAIGAALLLASWAIIGFAGFAAYPSLLRRVEDLVGDGAFTLYISGSISGSPLRWPAHSGSRLV